MKKKERNDSIIRHSSIVNRHFFVIRPRRTRLGAIIRPQDGFKNGSSDGPGLVGDREAIAYLASRIDIANF
jgi:hypothetical protein